MAVIDYTDVATSLGRPISSAAEQAQVTMWISDVELLIASRLGPLAELDEDALAYVVRETVADRVLHPDGASRTTVAVDDASVSKQYEHRGLGGFNIRDEWWALLTPDTTDGRGVFSARPQFTPETPDLDSWA